MSDAASPGPRVLVVDDAMTIRKYLCAVLTEAGFEVDAAINGVDGLERAMLAPPALIVSDINMPRMDGYRMVRAMRAKAELRSVPVVMLSTENSAADKDAAWKAGANHFLVKPPRNEEIIAVARLMTGALPA